MTEKVRLYLVPKKEGTKSKNESNNNESNNFTFRKFLNLIDGPNSKLIFPNREFKALKELYNEEFNKNGFVGEEFTNKIRQVRESQL